MHIDTSLQWLNNNDRIILSQNEDCGHSQWPIFYILSSNTIQDFSEPDHGVHTSDLLDQYEWIALPPPLKGTISPMVELPVGLLAYDHCCSSNCKVSYKHTIILAIMSPKDYFIATTPRLPLLVSLFP
jgi:hypothetical protein